MRMVNRMIDISDGDILVGGRSVLVGVVTLGDPVQRAVTPKGIKLERGGSVERRRRLSITRRRIQTAP